MSEAAVRQSASPGTILAIVVALVGAAILIWLIVTLPPDLDRSILGTRGFAIAAKKNKDLPIEFFNGNNPLKPNDFGLRILPLYDPDLFGFTSVENSEKKLGKENLRHIGSHFFQTKIRAIPTLVVLPKWRENALKIEKLHPDLLIRSRSMTLPYLGSVEIGQSEIRRGDHNILTHKPISTPKNSVINFEPSTEISLYIPQTISAGLSNEPRCVPLIQFQRNTLVAECRYHKNDSGKFWLLTDPDVLNNHGAGNGDNFEFAVALVSSLAKGRPILVDGTSRIYTNSRRAFRERARSFADLARFFAFPFSLIWGVLLTVILFTLWHAWLRTGPIIDREESQTLQASKTSAIEANVAILRGVDKHGQKDLPLAWTYVTQRMETLVAELFGGSRKAGQAGEEQFFSALARRNGELADKLKIVRTQLSASAQENSKQTLFENLNKFEQLTREAKHEFGRPSNPR